MGNVISNLKAKFGVDTTDFKKGLKDGEKAVGDFKGAAGDQIAEFASMFGVSMSGVTDAIGTVSKSLSFLGSAFKGAAKGGDTAAISFKLFKVAMVSTGLGAIVVVLGTIAAYFTKTGEGADKFAKILAQVKSVVNNVIDRLAIFGKGLSDILSGKFQEGWKTMTGAFKGMGDEIKEDWKASGALADAEDALEDREIALISSLSARKAKAAELRQQAKEEIDDQKKKLSLLNEAQALIKGVYGDEISLAAEGLRIMKEKLAIQTSDPTDEQRRSLAEKEGEINDLYRAQADELKGLAREKLQVLAIVNQELALEKAKAGQIAITNATISNLKMPDFEKLISAALAPMPKIQEAVKVVTMDLTNALNDAFANIAEGMGAFLGSLVVGDAGIQDFVKMIAANFTDLAITVGKIAIGAGMAVLGINAALKTLNPYAAIAAGVALIALGSAVKGSLKSAAGGGDGSASLSGSGSSGGGITYDVRSPQAQAITVKVVGELVAQGSVLKAVIRNEDNRLKAIT